MRDNEMLEMIGIINRQKAEIERLEKCRKEEVEKLMSAIDKVISEVKAEAYKECVEKVKVYFRETRFAYDAENLCEELDELLEEKLGE